MKLDIENLFKIARLPPINNDYNNNFLSQEFANNLIEYQNKFRLIRLNEICEKIDNRLIEYFERNRNNNLLDENQKYFIIIFFKINEILKKSHNLKQNFNRFMRERRKIVLKFLNAVNDMDSFIEDVKRTVQFNVQFDFNLIYIL